MTAKWHTPGYGWCGCQRPQDHEPGCQLHLDPDSRVELAMETVIDGFPAPRISLEREYEVIVHIHMDVDYARRVATWITSGRAA